MSFVIQAIYENGVLRPLEKLALRERQHVRLEVETNVASSGDGPAQDRADLLEGVQAATGILDLAEHFDDYRFGRRKR